MRAVVFDLDGTLIDSAPDIHAAANRLLAGEGLAALPFATVRSFIGDGVPTLVARLTRASGLAPDPARDARLVARFIEDYETALTLTAPYPGAFEALETLAARGFALGLCTNKPIGPTRAALAHFGLAPRFAAVIGGDSLERRKPDPAPLRATLAALGAEAGLFVGDSETDAETARRAGLPFLLFEGGYRKAAPEALPQAGRFARHADLPGLVERIAARAA